MYRIGNPNSSSFLMLQTAISMSNSGLIVVAILAFSTFLPKLAFSTCFRVKVCGVLSYDMTLGS